MRQPENARQVWDSMHLLSALQGLANREAPRLYALYCRQFGVDTDRFSGLIRVHLSAGR